MAKENIFDIKRYNRNILVPEINKEGQRQLFKARVLVCGAGGLASTVIANLASLGIRYIGIIDDDKVELSNLNRQYIHTISYLDKPKVLSAKNWIENYNKDVEIQTFQTRLDDNNYNDIVKNYDIVVDCFDSFESKFLLNDISLKMQKPLIHAGVTEFSGQVMTIIPNKSACLRCIFPDANLDACVAKGVVSPAVSLIASVQSMEILKLIINKGSLLTNKILSIDGLNARFKVLNVKKNSACECNF